jgi:hypothetical protein
MAALSRTVRQYSRYAAMHAAGHKIPHCSTALGRIDLEKTRFQPYAPSLRKDLAIGFAPDRRNSLTRHPQSDPFDRRASSVALAVVSKGTMLSQWTRSPVLRSERQRHAVSCSRLTTWASSHRARLSR